MNKTEFYKKTIKHILNADPEDMYYHVGARNYELVVDGTIEEATEKTRSYLNDFFEKTNIEYKISKEDILDITKKALMTHYSGADMICLHFEDIYEHLLDKNVFEANEEISVYRIESKNYTGFYCYFIEKDKPLMKKYDQTEVTPTPASDGVLAVQYMNGEFRDKSKDYIFGFVDKNQLSNWLNDSDGFIEDLLEEELYLSHYKVKEKDVLITKNQVAFSNEKSRVVGREPIKSFLENILKEKNTLEKDQKEVVDFLKNKKFNPLNKKNTNKNN